MERVEKKMRVKLRLQELQPRLREAASHMNT
jgi:hypothetical protein